MSGLGKWTPIKFLGALSMSAQGYESRATITIATSLTDGNKIALLWFNATIGDQVVKIRQLNNPKPIAARRLLNDDTS
jgi:hypothetical protein